MTDGHQCTPVSALLDGASGPHGTYSKSAGGFALHSAGQERDECMWSDWSVRGCENRHTKCAASTCAPLWPGAAHTQQHPKGLRQAPSRHSQPHKIDPSRALTASD